MLHEPSPANAFSHTNAVVLTATQKTVNILQLARMNQHVGCLATRMAAKGRKRGLPSRVSTFSMGIYRRSGGYIGASKGLEVLQRLGRYCPNNGESRGKEN